jgi:hypothetical protein
MKKSASPKKLQLSRETLGSLKNSELSRILGGDPQAVAAADLGQLALTSNYTRYEPCCVCV